MSSVSLSPCHPPLKHWTDSGQPAGPSRSSWSQSRWSRGSGGGKCGSPQRLPQGALQLHHSEGKEEAGRWATGGLAVGPWISVLLPRFPAFSLPCLCLFLKGSSMPHRGYRALLSLQTLPWDEGGGTGETVGGAPPRAGPAFNAGILGPGSAHRALCFLFPGRRQRPSPFSHAGNSLLRTPPSQLSSMEGANQKKDLLHSGLREAALSGVESARSKRSRSKSEPSPDRWQL